MTKTKDIISVILLVAGIILWVVLAWGCQTEFGQETVTTQIEINK